ncbi:unnamed protein product [Lupinus luteus]|uniref:Myb-like domain-containing protein n=1 Tax=Lupinus luteus TaxID=3873 RepID=A0AAV1W0K3_LUPLU
MEGHNLLHHHQRQQQQKQQNQTHNITNVEVIDRLPQWSIQETKEFLMIRLELDQAFMETKRNKQLWDVISNKMKDKGYLRTSEQCKCKWKNLVTRYKGYESMEPEAMRHQFPFYNELQAIFTARMQRMLWFEASELGSKKKAMKLSSEDEEDDNEESERDHHNKGITSSIRKKKKGKIETGGETSGSNKGLKEILEDFMMQQMQMESQWIEAFEARENERRVKEMEWRQAMETLENERIMNDQRWREREEQRRLREEARAEKRDVLITSLLNKFTREEK